MPTTGCYPPFPMLWDLNGNRYVDPNYNDLSLIHGHAFPPVAEALVHKTEGWRGRSRRMPSTH